MEAKLKVSEDLTVPYFQLKSTNQKSELRAYFLKSFQIYQKLFSCIKKTSSYFTRPEPLRHPLIFYYGHTAVFYVNKLIQCGLLQERLNPKYETIFAVGVNQMGWDDLNEQHYEWPTVEQTQQYRDQVKNKVLEVIDSYDGILQWNDKGWGILMGIQHEFIHLETSTVIIRRLPVDEVQSIQGFSFPNLSQKDVSAPENKLFKVPSFKKQYKVTTDNLSRFRWDNEIGERQISVDSFEVSCYLVSNAEFFDFVKAKGYETEQLWTQEGWKWRIQTKTQKPVFWIIQGDNYKLRTLAEVIDMPWDWPVITNNLEARAFCNWKSKQLEKQVRLPTQDQYECLVGQIKNPNQIQSNIFMRYGCSESAVNTFKSFGEVYDVIGNVWQLTCTLIYPFNGFQIHPYYEDFTTPTFDGLHDILKGGSFITQGSPQSRNFFRRHFYQFSGFRYVHSPNPITKQVTLQFDDKEILLYLNVHYFIKNNYIDKIFGFLQQQAKTAKIKSEKALVVGCSVGRLCFELSKIFNQVIGLDSTSRFFRIATLLQQKGFYQIKCQKEQDKKTIELKDYGTVNTKNMNFFQQKPDNIDIKKFNKFDLAIIDNFSLQENILIGSLSKIHSYLSEGGALIVSSISSVSPYNQFNQVTIESTLKDKFKLVAQKKISFRLHANEEDHLYSELSLWKLSDK